MTMPYERTRAVLNARSFLLRISSAHAQDGIKGIRKEVRQEARAILRHYPILYDITDPRAFDERAVDEWYKHYWERQAETADPPARSRDVCSDGRRKKHRS